MAGMRMRAALKGDLKAEMAREAKAIQDAQLATIKGETRRLQQKIRVGVRKAFPGTPGRRPSLRQSERAANSLRSKIYDDGPKGAAGVIYSKYGRRDPLTGVFVDYIAQALRTRTVRPNQGKYLFIPVGVQPRAVRRLAVSLNKNLRWVRAKDGQRIWLIRETKTRSTIIGFLIKRATIKRRLNVDPQIREAQKRLGTTLLDEIEKRAA